MPIIECPICHRTVACAGLDEVPYRPFCSQKCKLVDLGRWLNEEYRIVEETHDAARAGQEDASDLEE